LSGKFLQRSLFAAVDAILGTIVTSHTHRNVMIPPKLRANYLKNTLLCFPCAA